MENHDKYDFLIDEELRELQRTAQANGGSEAFAVLAKAYNVRGMFPQALVAAERATKLEEISFTGWFEYAIAASATGEEHLKRIHESTQRLLIGNRGSVDKLKTALALTNYYLSNDQVATTLATEVIKSDPSNAHAHEVLGYIAFNENDFKKALEFFSKAIDADVSNFRAHWMTGHCHFELNNLAAARASYSEAINHQPYFANAWFSLGKVLLVDDKIQAAYQCFAKTLSINPRMWDCYFTQADYYLGHRLYVSAVASCQRILELNPDKRVSSEALNYIGEVYLVQRDFLSAQPYFEAAIDCSPDNAVPYNNMGVTLLKNEQIEEAVEFFKAAIAKDPNFAYPITKLGEAYFAQKHYREATEMFKKALTVDPKEYWAWLGLGQVYRRQRRYKKLLEAVQKALEIEKEDSDVYNYLGIAYELLKNYEKAEDAYILSLELDPFNRKAANNLGFLYEHFLKETGEPGFRKKAIRAWKQRLLICRDTDSSTKGAVDHLNKLGIDNKTIEGWLAEEEVQDFSMGK
jgi:tetratricopeptide (TPR) repeat protein